MYCMVMVSELETVCTEHCSQTARLLNIITDHTHPNLPHTLLGEGLPQGGVTISLGSLSPFLT